MIRYLISGTALLAFSLLTANCSSKGKMKGDCGCKKDQAQQLSTGTDYYEYHKIYFSKAPSKEDLAAFKDLGIKVIIDLRENSEITSASFKEEAAAKEMGLQYFQAPLSKDKPLDRSELQAIEKKVMEHHKDHAILVHCSTGQRAAAWFAHHHIEHHKVMPKKAMKMAKKVGLKDKKMKEKVKTYLHNFKS